MAGEARISASLNINKRSGSLDLINYRSPGPQAYQVDVTGTKGPVPGAVTVSVLGTDIDFSELTTPGLVAIKNLDGTNWVEFGPYDPELDKFYPIFKVGPGRVHVGEFSPNMFEEYPGTGTGTDGASSNRLRFRANGSPVVVSVEAFET